jgi:MFS transporter, Spinster family, sphingosine-1-phosphate transporter
MTTPDTTTSRQSRLRWMALIVLTVINLLNYIDRYIFSALLPAIKHDLGFTDTQLGLLGSAFILAYLFISPVFGFLGDRTGRSKVMGLGLAVWSGATAFSGICTSFTGQMVTRVTVGLGESAYSVIAPSTIADYFAKNQRGKIFAIYSGAIPVGSALGYMLGGWLEPIVGWQKSFFVVGVPGLIMAVLLFFMRDPKRGNQDPDEVKLGEHLPLKKAYGALFGNGGFLFAVLGYAAYTFVVGGMAFWMPTYIVRYFDVTLAKGNIVFGGVTVVGGFIGTMLGGWWADRTEKRTGNGYLKVAVVSMIFAAPLFYVVLQMHSFMSFAAALFVMEIAVFLCISPMDAAVISYVRPGLRSTAMAVNVFMIHLLGDGISRALMGAMSDASDLRSAISLLPWVLVLAGVFWAIGMIFYWQPVLWPAGGIKLPRWQAHRGLRPDATVRENTLDAFRRARASGAEMSECDVRLSRDGQIIVFHDDDLKRLGGRADRPEDLTAKEMLEYVQAPRLVDFLRDSNATPFVNIEIKSSELRGTGALESGVAKAIQEADAHSRVIISSFNPFALRRIAKIAPEIPRALLVTEEADAENKIYLRKMWFAFLARPHMLNLDKNMITKNRVERWHERGIPVAAWTVNDPARARELLGIGVASIISDVLTTDARAGLT